MEHIIQYSSVLSAGRVDYIVHLCRRCGVVDCVVDPAGLSTSPGGHLQLRNLSREPGTAVTYHTALILQGGATQLNVYNTSFANTSS